MFLEKNRQNSNFQKVEIKYDDKTATHYSFRIYNRHPFLKKSITKDKFQNIIDNANNIIYDAKMKKAKFDKVEINNYIYFLFLFLLIIIIIYIILFFFSPRVDKQHQKRLKNSGLFFFCFIILTLFSLAIFNALRKIEGDKTLFDFYKDEMINYISQLNETYKDRLFFTYDENDKNIICYLKIDNEIISNNKSSQDDEKYSSQITKRSNTESDLYSIKN